VLLAYLPKLDDEKADLLFRYGGAAGTFSAKLKLAYALGLIDTETYKDLQGIRDVRNAFAHPRGFLHFDSPEVAKVFKRIKHWPQQPNLKALYDQRLRRATKAIRAKYDSLLYAHATKDA